MMFGFCLVDAQLDKWRQKLKTKTNIRIMNDTKGNSSANDKEKPLSPYAIYVFLLALDRLVRRIEAMLEVFDAICKANNEFGPWVSYAIAGVLASPLAVLMWFVQYREFSPYWADTLGGDMGSDTYGPRRPSLARLRELVRVKSRVILPFTVNFVDYLDRNTSLCTTK